MTVASDGYTRRVVITGVGLVAPIGIGKEAFWAAAQAGESGIGPLTRIDDPTLPIQTFGEVKGFEPTNYMSRKLVVRTGRNIQYSFAAASEAWEDAGLNLEEEDKSRLGLVMSCNYGGVEYYFDNLYRLYRMGPSFVSAYMAIAWIPSAPVGQLSIFMGISGYTKTIINDGTGGLDAIGAAYNSIRRDDCDVAITGGFEAVIAEPAILAVATWPGSCREKSNPESAFRPYSINRKGLVFGEGGATLILEELERARARGATIYGEIAGYAQTTDAVDIHQVAPDGVQYGRAMSLAVAASRLSPDDISCVIAEGQATEHADRAEARAIHRAFGDRQDGGARSLPVTAPRSMYGHAVAGAGALDAASASLALRHGAIPPTINVEPQDPECDLNLVRDRGREAELDAVLIGNRGLGGVNSALVIRRLD